MQVDDATLQKEMQARGGAGERNLWSGKVQGPRGDRRQPGEKHSKEVSKYRCMLEIDVGRTRGSDADQHVFCMYFTKCGRELLHAGPWLPQRLGSLHRSHTA
jgi:hypothetical protein